MEGRLPHRHARRRLCRDRRLRQGRRVPDEGQRGIRRLGRQDERRTAAEALSAEDAMRAGAKERYIIDGTGRRREVVLSVRAYEKLIEDLHDLAIVAERRDEETVSLAEMKRVNGPDVQNDRVPS